MQRHNRAITRWAAHNAKGHIAWVNLGSDNGVEAGETVMLYWAEVTVNTTVSIST